MPAEPCTEPLPACILILTHAPQRQGYTIQQSFLDFSILANVTVAANGTTQSVTLGPTQPVATSADDLLSLSLLGDLATYTSLPAVTGQYLLIPSPNGVLPAKE